MNRIVFSLYGSNPIYNVGMLRNLESLPKFFPRNRWRPMVVTDWISLPESTKIRFSALRKDNLDVLDVRATVYKDRPGHFWRFAPFTMPGVLNDSVSTVLFMDADSRVTARGAECFNNWIRKIPYPLYTILDHPNHSRGVALGNFGVDVGQARELGFFKAIEDTLPGWLANIPDDARIPGGEVSDEIFFRDCLLPKFSWHLWVDDFRCPGKPGSISPRIRAQVAPPPYDGPFIGEHIVLDEQGNDVPVFAERAQRAASFAK